MTYSIGIDSGSTATKGILLADGVITRRFLVPTSFRPATAITEAWETLREGLETTPFLTPPATDGNWWILPINR